MNTFEDCKELLKAYAGKGVKPLGLIDAIGEFPVSDSVKKQLRDWVRINDQEYPYEAMVQYLESVYIAEPEGTW